MKDVFHGKDWRTELHLVPQGQSSEGKEADGFANG